MTTERNDPTDEDLRSRFHELGEHMERSLDAPVSLHRAATDRADSVPIRRRLLVPVAAALLVAAAGGAWFTSRSSDGNDIVVTEDLHAASQPESSAGPSVWPEWPPSGEVHEHCVEDEATREMYAGSNVVSEEIRAQHCERRYHDLLVPVFTPEGMPDGAVSSAAMNDETASNELHELLTAQGLNSNNLAIQSAYQELWGAISNRHAVPVFDRDGQQIGWFGGGYEPDQGGFVSMEDMPKVRAEAERVIAEFERTGALPVTAPTDMPADDLGHSALEMLIVNEGVEVGWVDYELHRDELLQRLTDIVEIRAANPEVSDADFDDQAVGDALLVLSKIPVLERQGGDFIGYLGPEQVLISESDYPAERAKAESVIIEAGGTLP